MKYLVVSDTHGRTDRAVKLYKSLEGIDKIIHLGDYAKDGYRLEDKLGIPVIRVKGNMDGSYSNKDYLVINTEFGKVYLTHGHMESVKYSVESLLYKASSLGCKAALFGHTHIPLYIQKEGFYLLNPGSLSLPRGGRKASYAILKTGLNQFDATILYMQDDSRSKSSFEAKPSRGGFLRKVFNDSDGQ